MMYYASVRSWDELNNRIAFDKYLVHGENFGDATQKVAKYCGENNVEEITIELVAEDISVFPDEYDLNIYKDAQIW